MGWCSESGGGRWVGCSESVPHYSQVRQCSEELEELRRHIGELRQSKETLEGEVLELPHFVSRTHCMSCGLAVSGACHVCSWPSSRERCAACRPATHRPKQTLRH